MNKEQAIKWMKFLRAENANHILLPDRTELKEGTKGVDMAYNCAIAAIRAQQERENPQPLTLEQLKERVGKPVYVVGLSLLPGEEYPETTGWYIQDRNETYFRANYWCAAIKFLNKDYGALWLAYDHEPKAVQP